MEAPEDLRDFVWMPAHLEFANGGESVALIPTRYPGSEQSADGVVALARKTTWEEVAPTSTGDWASGSSRPTPTRSRSWTCDASRSSAKRHPTRSQGHDRTPASAGSAAARPARPADRRRPRPSRGAARGACALEAAGCGSRCCGTSPGCSTRYGSNRSRTSPGVPRVAIVRPQLRAAGAVGRRGILARRHGPRRAPSGRRSSTSSRASCPNTLRVRDAARARRARPPQRRRRGDPRPPVGAAGAARIPGAHRVRSRDRQGADRRSPAPQRVS